MQTIQTYLLEIHKIYTAGNGTEHSYRPALQKLLESINSDLTATNEPKREKCGAPDYVITDKKGIPRGYIEAKDIVKNILDDAHEFYAEGIYRICLMPENCEKAMRAGIIEMTGKPTDIKIHRLLGRDATEH